MKNPKISEQDCLQIEKNPDVIERLIDDLRSGAFAINIILNNQPLSTEDIITEIESQSHIGKTVYQRYRLFLAIRLGEIEIKYQGKTKEEITTLIQQGTREGRGIFESTRRSLGIL